MNTDPLLVIDDVHKSFGGVTAVDGCSFSLTPGRVVGLIGPNGAGKTSLIDLVSGFTRPDRGGIRFDGRDVVGLRPDQISRLGVVRTFQSPREWGGLTVSDNVLLGCCRWDRESFWRAVFAGRRLRSLDEADRRTVDERLDRFQLLALRDEAAGRLSGGQKRLLEFARIAAAAPRLIVLDEPMGGVNPVLGERIGDAVREFADEGRTVLVVEHNLPFIERTCDEVVVMDLGRVIAQGPFAALRDNPQVVDAYLGAEEDHA